jgi:4-phospho-D-threonate 3-dehydrogenase / 4-phospho-D-erythronate 3-dehydrogenase
MIVDKRPIIAITIGDAAGVGPEIVVKALRLKEIYDICRPLVLADAAIISDVIKSLKSELKLHRVRSSDGAEGEFGTVDIIDFNNLDRKEVIPGQICIACARAAMEYITRAAELAQRGKVKAVVTAPINKEAIMQAGYGDVGHLEFFARITHTVEYAIMLVSGPLRVVHLSTHYSLRDACERVSREKILAKLRLTHDSLQRWGVNHPRIAVAALNPHGGEGGLLGSEEIEQIQPAVKEARESGINALGPFPADSVFTRAIKGEFDVVLAMYHDQGHIPVKVYGFERSISVALGLPFIRTSVDHGTAFDIAGKGIASSKSLEEAIKVAVRLIEGKLV